MATTVRDERELPFSTVQAIEAATKRPDASDSQLAGEFGVHYLTVRKIRRHQHPAQQRAGRCARCRGKLLNKSKPCRACSLPNSPRCLLDA